MSLGTQVLALVAHAKPAKTKAEPKSRKSQKGGAMMAPSGLGNYGAPTTYKEPSMADRMKDRARSEKLNATSDYVAGRISGKAHDRAHARANEVLRNARYLARDGGKR